MKTNDMVFAKEFREMMYGRRSMTSGFKVTDLPLPALDTLHRGVPKRKLALIKGIPEPFFDRLNGSEVELVGRTTLKKRQVLSDGTFRKDENGNYVTEPVTVSQDCVAVLSPISIGLRRYVDGREHKVSKGYKYVDYVDLPSGRRYIYIVPRAYVYRLNLCALILTPNRRRVFFKGCKLALQNGHYIYLYVIPYTYRENMDAVVVGVKSIPDFDKEVMTILTYWTQVGVIFPLRLTALEGNVRGLVNLGIEDLEGTVVVDDFQRYGVSMAEELQDDLEEASS